MARKKRNRKAQRDHLSIARPLLRAPKTVFQPLAIDDRRLFHPDRPYHAPFTRPRDVKVVHDDNVNKRNARTSIRVGGFKFAVPKRAGVCVRRKSRREVLFALRRAGKGSRARVRRRNAWSDVRC